MLRHTLTFTDHKILKWLEENSDQQENFWKVYSFLDENKRGYTAWTVRKKIPDGFRLIDLDDVVYHIFIRTAKRVCVHFDEIRGKWETYISVTLQWQIFDTARSLQLAWKAHKLNSLDELFEARKEMRSVSDKADISKDLWYLPELEISDAYSDLNELLRGPDFTDKERKIFQMKLENYMQRDMAVEFGVSETSISFWVCDLLKKLREKIQEKKEAVDERRQALKRNAA